MKSDSATFSKSPEAIDLANAVLAVQRSCLTTVIGEANRMGISFTQFLLLSYLEDSEPVTMTSISKLMHHTTAAATGLVDRLRMLGFVSRDHDKNDRRKVLVSLTTKGSKLVQKVKQDMADLYSPAFQELNASERKASQSAFKKIAAFGRLH